MKNFYLAAANFRAGRGMTARTLSLALIAGLGLGAGAAHADGVIPIATLSSAYPLEISQGINTAVIDNGPPPTYANSTAAGVLDVASKYGTAHSQVYLGLDPGIILNGQAAATTTGVNGNQGDDASGGYDTLDYYLEWKTLPGTHITSNVTFIANDTVSLSGGPFNGLPDHAGVRLIVSGGPNNANIVSAQDCVGANACYEGYGPATNLSSITTVTLTSNYVYEVSMLANFAVQGPLLGAVAEIDPRFVLPNTAPGSIIYSEGVISAAPEPAAWALMLVGFAGLGAALRTRRSVGNANATSR